MQKRRDVVGAGLLQAIAEGGTAGARMYREQQEQERLRRLALVAGLVEIIDTEGVVEK